MVGQECSDPVVGTPPDALVVNLFHQKLMRYTIERFGKFQDDEIMLMLFVKSCEKFLGQGQ